MGIPTSGVIAAALLFLGAASIFEGRRRHSLLFASPVLIVVGLIVGFFAWQKWAVETPATSAARALTGRSVTVECRAWWNEGTDNAAHAGFVRYDGDEPPKVGYLRRSYCGSLRSWLRSSKDRPTDRQVVAVHVLAHEIGHLTGLRDEPETECWAVQHNAEVAKRLGASPGQAVALQRVYWERMYPNMPPDYRTGACVEDGPLDLSPGDGVWP